MNSTDSFLLRPAGPQVCVWPRLLTRRQLHELERVMARIAATLRGLLEGTRLDSADRQVAAETLAKADERLIVIRALLERGLYDE